MRKTIIALLIYLGLFTIMFFVALYGYSQQISVIPLGIGAKTSNLFLMFLSFAGIVKTFVHLVSLG